MSVVLQESAAVTMAIRWGQEHPCCEVVRAIAELHGALAAPPAPPKLSEFNPWCKLL